MKGLNDPQGARHNVEWDKPIVIDFETYYDKEYSLAKITTEKYIRCDKFECIGVSIKVADEPTLFFPREEGISVIQKLVWDYPNRPFVAHNSMFDMGIIGLRYDIHPQVMADTTIMAKLCAFDRIAGGVSLAKLAEAARKLNLVHRVKGDTVHSMLGVHAVDMTDMQWQRYAEYCKLDTELCYTLYMYMLPQVPKDEMLMISITNEMWNKPSIQLDVPLLQNYALQLEQERENALNKIAADFGFTDNTELLKHLRSSKKFVVLLERLKVDVPMKWSEKQKKMIPAVSKTDVEFLQLLEHHNPAVRALVETKLGTTSSMEQTRTATFLDVASRGLCPVPLRYAAAHTGRYGGCFVGESLVLVREKDPELDKFEAKLKFIKDLTPADLVWDGENFVTHSGVVCRGVQAVYNYDGVCGTLGHEMFFSLDSTKTASLETFRNENMPLCRAYYTQSYTENVYDNMGCKLGEKKLTYAIDLTETVEEVKSHYAVPHYPDGTMTLVYDILFCGRNHRYAVNGKLAHNSDGLNYQNLPKRTKEPVLRRAMTAPDDGVIVASDSSNIEVRVLAYMAQQNDVIDVFLSGRDVYVDMAAKIYSEPYDVILDQSKINPTKEGKTKRNIAKAVVLGCGYGASANKFAELMKQQGLEEFADMANELVTTYRTANYKIVEFWRECDRALNAMYGGGSMWFGGANSNLFYADGSSKFHGVQIPSIKLPNGTYIFYQNLRQETDENDRTNYVYDQFRGRNWIPKRIWGSAFAENLCQALSFAILKHQALDIYGRGVPINLNVHDEWVSIVSREEAAKTVIAHYNGMQSVPSYIPDGLLDCEVDVGANYADLKTINVGYYV